MSESMAPQWRRCVVTAKQVAVKKYVVELSDAERERLSALIHVGKHPARLLTRARILLKADISRAGEGWSDSRIATALDTSTDTVARTRQQLVEEGFAAVLVRKHSPASARPRIFDGAAEAKLIALACSKPPTGRKRWTLQLLEEQVVELKIVDRASDNTIGRTLKKTSQASSAKAMGHPAGCQRRLCSRHGGCAGGLPATARSRMSAGLPGRGVEATYHRDAGADRGDARTPCTARLRVRAEWNRQSVHDVRAPGRLAPCQGHRSPHRRGLCTVPQGFVRHALSRGEEDRARAGQS